MQKQSNSEYQRQIKEMEQCVKRIEIKKAALVAITHYLDWLNEQNRAQRGPQWFNFSTKQVQTQRELALRLKQDIKTSEPIAVINAFLGRLIKRQNHKVLAAFLLKELSQIKNSPWQYQDHTPHRPK